ncbi:MAG: 50S ribosomal protein L10 [Candidatus Hodarchaeales archaeon]
MSASLQLNGEKHEYPEKKIREIEDILEALDKYNVIGIARLDGISSSAIQGIRKILYRDFETVIKVSKNTLKRIAFARSSKKGIKELADKLDGSCALVFSNANPYNLQKFLNENQVDAPAKAGMVATSEVIIPAGPTDMNPGPVIGELNSIGARASVQKGKIHIMKDSTVLKEGDTVTETHASVLNRLGIMPFKIGMSLYLALEDGKIIHGKDLVVDEGKIMNDMLAGYQDALKLSLFTGYPVKDTIEQLLAKAYREALSLAMETGFPTDKNIEQLIAKAAARAKGIADQIGFDSS